MRSVVVAIPEGTVVTYGEVAREAGTPGAARAVGNVLAGSDAEHAAHLRAEGVRVVGGRVARHEAFAQEGI